MAEWERARLSFLILWTVLIFLGTGAAGGFGLYYLITSKGNSTKQSVNSTSSAENSSSAVGSTLKITGTTTSSPWYPRERQNITEEEYAIISQQLWDLDINRLSDDEFQINLQTQTNTSMSADLASQPLFSSINADLTTRTPIFQQFLSLINMYQPQTKLGESLTPVQWEQINAFVDDVLNTTMMKDVHGFLVKKGYSSLDGDIWRSQFMNLWFWLYPRSPKYNQTDSSGFEHVFVGERRGMKTLGFHSWLQAYTQEQNGHMEYHGYILYYKEARVLNIQVKWRGGFKKQASMFMGTSPEFDMAVYTLCALSRIGRQCPLKINNRKVPIATWDVQHKPGVQIASAYPAV